MLFYFTGSGNSLFAAKQLLHAGERLINMAAAWKDGQFAFDRIDGERVGFVFPTYCFSIGDAVCRFVEKLEISGTGYTFAVITCGDRIGGAGGLLRQKLAKRGIELNAVWQLPMPDCTVFYYPIVDKAAAEEKLKKSEETLAKIKNEVEAEKHNAIPGGTSAKLMRGMVYLIGGTGRFRVNDTCIHCGKCARNCPDQAIRMENGKPVWIKSHCTKCSACINRCPVQAIQYGKATEKRNRYTNPNVKL